MNAWFTVEHSTAFHFLHVGHLVESLCDSCLLLGVASLMKAERCSDLWTQQQSLEAILILCPFSRIIVLASSLGSRTQLSRVIFQNTNAMSVCLMIIYAEKWQNFFLENQTQFLMWRAYNDCVVTFATFGVGVTLLKQPGPASHSLTKLFTWLNHKPLTNFTYIFFSNFICILSKFFFLCFQKES